MTKHTMTYPGGLTITIEAPGDLPHLDITVHVFPDADPDADLMIAAVGGLSEFEEVKPGYNSLRADVGSREDPAEVGVVIFTPRESDAQQPEMHPWLAAKRDEQKGEAIAA